MGATFRRLGPGASYMAGGRLALDRLPRSSSSLTSPSSSPEMDGAVEALSKLEETVHLYEVTGGSTW
jgi:hypothetical protein